MNVWMLLEMACEGFGKRVVIGRRDTGLTAAQLRELALRGAEALRSAGADSLLYFAVGQPAFQVALFAAARAGIPFVPLNYRLGSVQLDSILSRHCGALALAKCAGDPALVRAGLTCLSIDGWMVENGTPANALNDMHSDRDAIAVLIYTSGSTAEPKAVLLRHGNLMAYVVTTVEFGAAEPDEAALMCVPPYHIAAVANSLTNLYAGRRLVVMDAFDAEAWVSLVRSEAITHAFVVPTMLARIVELACDGRDMSLPSLRTLAYGGARMPRSVIERALEMWSEVDFVNAYGLTETASTVSVLGPDAHRAAVAATDEARRARLSSAGLPLPTIEVQIRDESGSPLAVGKRGRIWVRGDQVAGEYAASGSALDEHGFFDTRDDGYLDDEGYLYVEGRADDTIIRGAENIAPAEIETVLMQHAAVREAVVVGLPDDEWGERLAAVVVPHAGFVIDIDELRDFARGLLRGSKTPESIHVWDELPATETGKVLRRVIVARLVGSS